MSFCEGPSAGTGSTILGMVSLSGMFEIKPLSATDQLRDLGKIVHLVMPQFLHLSNGVANIIPTWWDPG